MNGENCVGTVKIVEIWVILFTIEKEQIDFGPLNVHCLLPSLLNTEQSLPE